MWTKRQIIDAAFTEIGMGQYVFDVQPEELTDALLKLDSLMAEWIGEGIVVGYVPVDNPATIELDGDSDIPANLVRPVIDNLAVNIAPMFGKQPSPITLKNARKGYSIALGTIPTPFKRQNVTAVPAGSGYRNNYSGRYVESLPPDEAAT